MSNSNTKTKEKCIGEFLWYESPDFIEFAPEDYIDKTNKEHVEASMEEYNKDGYVITDTKFIRLGIVQLKTRCDKPPEDLEAFKIKFYGHLTN